jgi:hypothetical protein
MVPARFVLCHKPFAASSVVRKRKMTHTSHTVNLVCAQQYSRNIFRNFGLTFPNKDILLNSGPLKTTSPQLKAAKSSTSSTTVNGSTVTSLPSTSCAMPQRTSVAYRMCTATKLMAMLCTCFRSWGPSRHVSFGAWTRVVRATKKATMMTMT